jgi:uncharacterized protein (TIGR03435 family)
MFSAVLGLSVPLLGQSQLQQKPLAFEVASIKPSDALAPRGGFGMSPSGLFQVQGISLAELIQAAYTQGRPYARFQMTGGPDWLDSARFDITGSSTVRDATPAQTMAMVKTLLIDRFKVVVRQETREGPIYLLTLAKKDGSLGPRMKKSSLTCPGPGCDYKIMPGRSLMARGLTIDRLAFSMINFPGVGRLIVDRTGLTGGYDMDMEWSPGEDGLSIFTALREQLGLKLESSRGPVPMLVIDHVERPTPD